MLSMEDAIRLPHGSTPPLASTNGDQEYEALR